MAYVRCGFLGSVLSLVIGAAVGAAEPVALREVSRTDAATHVVIELTAEGELRPTGPPGGVTPAAVPLKVASRFDFLERPVDVEPGGAPRKTVRQVRQAATAINGQIRPMASSIRPEVGILVAELRAGRLFTFSPGGPLTRSELDMVQGPADPMMLGLLLPETPVSIGDSWSIGAEAARALGDYEALAANTLKATLETLDATSAKIALAGEVRGASRGGEGVVTIDGTLTFDREAGLIRRLDLNRVEVRQPGHVEAGFEFRGALTVERTGIPIPTRLTDAALEPLELNRQAHLDLLRFVAPDGAYTFLHDRDWHLFWDDARLAVLKRLDNGEFLAQCNLAAGPNAGPGRHQDPAQFRADIKTALGERFVTFLSQAELGESDGGLFRYRVAVQGREGDRAIVWFYYLIANPKGDQLLGTFTLNAEDVERFGDQDVQLIGSLEWREGTPGSD